METDSRAENRREVASFSVNITIKHATTNPNQQRRESCHVVDKSGGHISEPMAMEGDEGGLIHRLWWMNRITPSRNLYSCCIVGVDVGKNALGRHRTGSDNGD
jgi:hypothetical protein